MIRKFAQFYTDGIVTYGGRRRLEEGIFEVSILIVNNINTHCSPEGTADSLQDIPVGLSYLFNPDAQWAMVSMGGDLLSHIFQIVDTSGKA